MKKKVYRRRKLQRFGSNQIDAATTSPSFPKTPKKRTKGVAGKGGKTTNFEIPEWMFKRELEEMEGKNNA